MTIEQLLQEKREAIQRIAVQHGASNVRVFGSVARREANADSDVDLLIDAGPTTSSWFPEGLILDLEELWGKELSGFGSRWILTEIHTEPRYEKQRPNPRCITNKD